MLLAGMMYNPALIAICIFFAPIRSSAIPSESLSKREKDGTHRLEIIPDLYIHAFSEVGCAGALTILPELRYAETYVQGGTELDGTQRVMSAFRFVSRDLNATEQLDLSTSNGREFVTTLKGPFKAQTICFNFYTVLKPTVFRVLNWARGN